METSVVRGLTKAVVDQKLQEYGKNSLSEKAPVPWFVKLFHELTTVFALLLWGSGILCLIVYGLSPTDPSNVNIVKFKFIALFSNCLVSNRVPDRCGFISLE